MSLNFTDEIAVSTKRTEWNLGIPFIVGSTLDTNTSSIVSIEVDVVRLSNAGITL